MAAVGLTHGGFYKQFGSKEALAAEATGQAFAEFLGQLPERDPDRPEDHVAARTALLDHYFSPEHRDDPGTGCPVSALATDLAHEAADSPVRAIYVKGAEDLAQWLTTDGDEDLATLSTMVGALLLARPTSGTGLSGRVLAAARASIET
jgi:TetR/AcrR family transcriptional repressor of nem operon